MKNFSSRVKQLRADSTLQEFSNKIGVNLKTYQHYEAGTRKPNVKAILQIAVGCGVTTDWLLGLNESKDVVHYTATNLSDPSKDINVSVHGKTEHWCPECAKKNAEIEQLKINNSRLTELAYMKAKKEPSQPLTARGGQKKAIRQGA